ncbi:hypothetical protein Y046_3876 [Burkholderia pseudomallei MSHR2990]|nr:hypothetical protein Y046_3876 [Burkholderia pseudomallei MSHR2990]KGW98781.1 hypothetical protein Y030_6078 [Burkholderia pseudomallei MSHR332]
MRRIGMIGIEHALVRRHAHRRARERMRGLEHRHAERRLQVTRLEHRIGRALRDDPPGAHQHDLVAVRGRLVEVVQHPDDREPARAIEPPQLAQDVELVMDVEISGRLVEQHDGRLLRERHRDPGALPLAARQRGHVARRVGFEARRRERLVDRVAVRAREPAQPAAVRVAAVRDELAHREPRGNLVELREHRQRARERAPPV